MTIGLFHILVIISHFFGFSMGWVEFYSIDAIFLKGGFNS